MNKKKIINYIFDDLENEGLLNFRNNEDYASYSKINQKKSEEVFDYIKKHIHSKKVRKALLPLIENYVDSYRDLSYCAFKICYYKGFTDGIEFITK